MEGGIEEITISDFYTLHVKFSNGEMITLKEIAPRCSIGELIPKIKEIMEEVSINEEKANILEGKYIKLIFEGKILLEDQNVLQCRITDGSVLHCSLSDFPSAQHVRQVLSQSHALPTMIEGVSERRNTNNDEGAEVENLLDPIEIDTGENNGTNNDERVPEGFDRMRDQGFTEEEVAFFRNQFYSSRPHLLTQLENGEVNVIDLRRIEEQWLNEEDPLGGTENILRNDPIEDIPLYQARQHDGSELDVFYGACFGFFFGVVSIIIFCLNVGVSKKFKVGVMFGMFINASFGILALIY